MFSSPPPFRDAGDISDGRKLLPDHDAVWLGETGAAPPELIARLFDLAPDAQLFRGMPVTCFAPLLAAGIAASVRRVRATLGEMVHLVLVFPGAELPANAARAIDLGADDVACADDQRSLQLARARGSKRLLERRQAAAIDRILSRERAYLQACIDNLPTPIYFKDHEGRYVGCNRAFSDYLGLPFSSIVGATVHELADPEYADVYHAADTELFEKGGVQNYEAAVCYADGTRHEVAFQKAAMVDEDGRVRGLAGAMLDITERKRLERELADAAARDPLTNLFNRRHFFSCVSAQTAGAAGSQSAAVAIIDIDRFKAINDRYGHAMGDAVICAVARELELRLAIGVVARAGGEEFYVFLPTTSLQAAAALLDLLRIAIADLVVEDAGQLVSVRVSIGVAAFRGADETLWEALRRADAALYRAKEAGRDRIVLAA